MHNEHKLKIFAGRSSRPFAEKIVKALGINLGESDVLTFSDGEEQADSAGPLGRAASNIRKLIRNWSRERRSPELYRRNIENPQKLN